MFLCFAVNTTRVNYSNESKLNFLRNRCIHIVNDRFWISFMMLNERKFSLSVAD